MIILTGITSCPIPSAGINPTLKLDLAAVEKLRVAIRKAILVQRASDAVKVQNLRF